MIITREQGQAMVSVEFKKHKFLEVNYATGFGKMKAALDAVLEVWGYYSHGLIVCHSQSSRDIDTKEDIAKWHPQFLSQPRICYDSMFKFDGWKLDWVILDEGHYITPDNMEFFVKNQVKSIIILTAIRPENSEKRQMLDQLSKQNRMQITLDQAVNSLVLPDYTIAVWKIKLTINEWQGYLDKCAAYEKARRSGVEFLLQQRGLDRQRYLGHCESKIKAAMYIRDKIREKGKRFVMYSVSKEVCEMLSEYRFHYESGVNDYNRFRDGEINELSCIKKLKENANVKGLGSAIVEQINSKKLDLIQMLGRLMRLPVGETARLHILLASGTMDESWWQKASMAVDRSKIHTQELDRKLFDHYDLEQLKN
jgi:superfamily II DNA or RNA helicase